MSNIEKNRNTLKKIAYAGVLASLVFAGTELHIPTAIGHINLGDLVILVSFPRIRNPRTGRKKIRP